MYKAILKISKNKFATDALWTIVGNLISKALILVSMIYIARIIGKESYGEFSLLRNSFILLTLFSTLGLGISVVKFVSNNYNKPEAFEIYKTTQIITLIGGLVFSVFLIINANKISINLLKNENLIPYIYQMCIFLVFNALNTTQINTLVGLHEFKLNAKISIIIGIESSLVYIISTYYFGFQGLIFTLILNSIITWLLYRHYLSKIFKNRGIERYKLNLNRLKELLSFSYPIALTEAIYSITTWTYMTTLATRISYGELGLLNASTIWVNTVLFIPTALSSFVLAKISQGFNTDINTRNKILKTNILINLIITSIIGLSIIIFSNFIQKQYGTDFIGLQSILLFSILSTIPTSASNVINQYFIGKEKVWYSFIFTTSKQILLLLIIFSSNFFWDLSANTISKAMLISYSIVFLVQIILLKFERK